jgi:predicted PurR-regulated permease PerM
MSSSEVIEREARPVRRLQAPTPRVALLILAIVVVGVLLYLGRSALTPFIVGALLVYLLDPAVDLVARLRVGRWHPPRWLAVLIVYIATFFIVVEGLALLLGPLFAQVAQYLRDLPRLLESLDAVLADISRFYETLDLPPQIRDYINGVAADLGRGAARVDAGTLLPIARTVVGTIAALFGFLIIPIWAFYILRDRVRLAAAFEATLPAAWRPEVRAVLEIVEKVLGRWVRAQIILGLIVGAATYAGLLVLGNLVDPQFLRFAVLLAVIAGLFELLPIIGPILSMIPTLLLALTTGDPLLSIVGVVVLYTAIQQVENAVLVPKIQGDAVELHPSVVIFVLIVGAAIAGLPGAIFAVPVTAAARNVFAYLFRRLSDEESAVPVATVEPAPDAVDDGTAAGLAQPESHLPPAPDAAEDKAI